MDLNLPKSRRDERQFRTTVGEAGRGPRFRTSHTRTGAHFDVESRPSLHDASTMACGKRSLRPWLLKNWLAAGFHHTASRFHTPDPRTRTANCHALHAMLVPPIGVFASMPAFDLLSPCRCLAVMLVATW